MKKDSFFKIGAIAVSLILLFPAIQGRGIPAFARKYQISCQVCHAPAIPRLKSFGDEFARNGYRMTKYESPRYFVPTGDDKLSLFRELPLAIRLDGQALINLDKNGQIDFAAPYILKLLSGGEISEKISYYFYFLMVEGGSIVGIEDAFLVLKDVFKTGINFYFGQFQASDPLFKSELRYTSEGYKIYSASPGNSLANLKYERGIMLEKLFKTGTTFQVEVLNGCGIDQGISDIDKNKNFMFRVLQSVGKNVTAGLFYYTGREDLQDRTAPFTNNIKMVGPDFTFNFSDKFVVNAQYVKRTDSQVFLQENGSKYPDAKTRGGFVELIFSPKGDMSRWYLDGLVNFISSDIPELDYRSATLHAGYLLRRNMKLVTEYTYEFSGAKYGRASVGFVTAF